MHSLILHAGAPKTGTAAIQRTLSKGTWDALLHEQQICYLKHQSVSPNHSKYFHSLCGRPESASSAVHNENIYLLNEAVSAVQSNTPRDNKILISAESICPIAQDYDNLAIIEDFIANRFRDIAIVLYVREPLSFICSRVQQGLKNAYPLTPALNNAIKSADCTVSLRNLEHIFGGDNVSVRSFDPAMLLEGEVITDFCMSALGLPDSPQIRHRIGERTEHNFTMPSELMELIMMLYANRSVSTASVCSRFVQRVSGTHWEGSRFGLDCLPENIRGHVSSAADRAREATREYLGYDCFPSYRPESNKPSPAETAAEQLETYRSMVKTLHQLLKEYGEPRHTDNIPGKGAPHGKSSQTCHDAKSEAYRLLERYYELCERTDTRTTATIT